MRHGSHSNPVKPKGYHKPKSRLKVARSPVYIPTANESKMEVAQWLRRQ